MRRPFIGIVIAAAVIGCGSSETGSGGKGGEAGAGVGASGGGGEGGDGGAQGGSGGAGGGVMPMPGPITGSVTRYDYAFDRASLALTTKLTVNAEAPGGDCFAMESLVTPTGDVLWNDTPALSSMADGATLNVCGTPLSVGVFSVQATTSIPKKKYYGLDVGYSVKKDLAGGDFSYVVSWVGGCDSFGPCDDDPGTLAELHFEITHAAGDVVLCPGALTAGETVTKCDVEGTLAPTYSGVGWASDPLWKRTPWMNFEGVEWVFYEVPGGKLAASLDNVVMGDFFSWLTGMWSPFPYGKELRFAGGPTAWLGFEHPANIVLQQELADLATSYSDGMTHVTMHEVVHQWAGDRTTIATANDFVWKEAIAEYIPYVFEDMYLGADVAAVSREYWDSISLFSEHFPRPDDTPVVHVSQFYGDVYGPGPMVLFIQLEPLIGREVVLNGIAAFLKDPGTRSVEDLKKALETASGKDLSKYFDVWVFGAGKPEWPTVSIQTMPGPGAGEVTVTVTQENASGALYGCEVEVDVKGATETATATLNFGVAPTMPSVSVAVPFTEAVVGTELDPRNRLIVRLKGSMLAAPQKPPIWIF